MPDIRLQWLLALVAAATGPAQGQSWDTIFIPAKDIRLEASVMKPAGEGPFPVALFNHGSTGKSGAVAVKQTLRPNALAPELVRAGFAVIAPMRRGRGQSGGEYSEPYQCNQPAHRSGLDSAIEDLDHVFAHLRTLAYADPAKIVLMGHSRGGLLSVAYAAQRPGAVRAVVNFAGGWTTEQCALGFNEAVFAQAAATPAGRSVPMLFVYAEPDSYYPAHAIQAFSAPFEKAGAKVLMKVYPAPGRDGHFVGAHPDVYRQDLLSFVGDALR